MTQNARVPFTIVNTIRLSIVYTLKNFPDLAKLMALPVIIPTLLAVISATADAYGYATTASFVHYLALFVTMATYVMFCVATHRHVSMQERGNVYGALVWNGQKTIYAMALVFYVVINGLAFMMLLPAIMSQSLMGILGGFLMILATSVLTSLILPAAAVGDAVAIKGPFQLGRDNFGKLLGVHVVFFTLLMAVYLIFVKIIVMGVIAIYGDLPPPPSTEMIGNSLFMDYMQINMLGTKPVADGGLAGLPFLIISLLNSTLSHSMIALYLVMLSLFYIRATEQADV